MFTSKPLKSAGLTGVCPGLPVLTDHPSHSASIHRVSRSETSGAVPSSQSSTLRVVSEYLEEELRCEGSELCFEEVRAARYFRRCEEQQEVQTFTVREKKMYLSQAVTSLNQLINSHMVQAAVGGSSGAPDSTQHSEGRPLLYGHRRGQSSLGLRLHEEPPFIHKEGRGIATSDPEEGPCPTPLTEGRAPPPAAPTDPEDIEDPEVEAAATQ